MEDRRVPQIDALFCDRRHVVVKVVGRPGDEVDAGRCGHDGRGRLRANVGLGTAPEATAGVIGWRRPSAREASEAAVTLLTDLHVHLAIYELGAIRSRNLDKQNTNA